MGVSPQASALERWIGRIADVRPGELEALVLSFLYNFLLMGGYYTLKPVRDALGLELGTQALPSLFLWTMGVIYLANVVYGKLVNRFSRTGFISGVYRFFAANLLLFGLLLQVDRTGAELFQKGLIATFFLWVSVFNLFVVAIFWSFMNDVWTTQEGKRLFGLIGAGAIAGAMCGSAATAGLVQFFRAEEVLLVGVLTLEACVRIMYRIHRLRPAAAPRPGEGASTGKERPQASGASGLALVLRSRYLLLVALFMFLLTSSNTFLYFQLNELVQAEIPGKEARAAHFATLYLAVNVVSLAVQLLVTGAVLKRFDVRVGLASVPVVMLAGSLLFFAHPALTTVTLTYVAAYGLHYSLNRASREVLYTATSPEEKYKAKSFNDTFVYRAGDATSAGLVQVMHNPPAWLLGTMGSAAAVLPVGVHVEQPALLATLVIVGVAFIAARLAVIWLLGREFNDRTRDREA